MLKHYNSPDRFSAPWEDCGKHKTRTAGLRRIWIMKPDYEGDRWRVVIAGQGTSSGATKEEAMRNAVNW
jgi:hypothetical protein